jgi:peptidyl-prolyl cis-trans isomerase C
MSEYIKAPWVRLSALAAASLMLAACNKGATTSGADAASAASAKPDSDVVATVNGATISRGEYDLFTKTLIENKQAPPEPTSEQKSQILDQMVTIQLLSAQGAKDGLESTPDVKTRLELLHMRLLADAESIKYLKDHEATDAELKPLYEKVIADGEATEYHARHILVDSKDKADKLIKKINGGAKFEDVAKAESSDPSKSNGGDLGWFNTNRMVKPFAEAVRKLKKGEMTAEPVQSQFGWHIIKLEDTRDPSFEQLKPALSNNFAQKKLFAYIEDLKKTATVDKKL